MSKIEIKKYSAAFAAVVLISITALSASTARADTNPSAPPTFSGNSYKVALEQYKRDREIFIAAVNDRQVKMRDINLAFKNSVDKANADSRNAIAAATTPLQKSTAVASRRNAIDVAINARDAAISALGPPPPPPAEPIREEKQPSNNGQGGKGRR
jgi:hypothetical protein